MISADQFLWLKQRCKQHKSDPFTSKPISGTICHSMHWNYAIIPASHVPQAAPESRTCLHLLPQRTSQTPVAPVFPSPAAPLTGGYFIHALPLKEISPRQWHFFSITRWEVGPEPLRDKVKDCHQWNYCEPSATHICRFYPLIYCLICT